MNQEGIFRLYEGKIRQLVGEIDDFYKGNDKVFLNEYLNILIKENEIDLLSVINSLKTMKKDMFNDKSKK
jgi:pantothenate kinase type III